MKIVFSSLILLLSKYHFWCLVFLIGLSLVYFLTLTLFAGGMNARVEKTCLMRCFFLGYGFESKRTVSQDWLTDVTGQLKKTCDSLCECCCLLDLLRLISAPKVFHHALIEFVSIGSPSFFHFTNSSSNFRTVFLFALSLTFYDITDKFLLFVSISLSVLLIKAVIALPFPSSFPFSLVLDCW